MISDAAATPTLEDVLERARTVGFLGPGPIRDHIEHAERYLRALPDHPGHIIDLGSGGGVPGLPILIARHDITAALVDASTRRVAFLEWAIGTLDLAGRASAHAGRAEELAHDDEWRGRADVVVARGFGPPASTLENARGFIRDGGLIIISEPPDPREWPAEALEELALRRQPSGSDVAVFMATAPPPLGWPRRHKQQLRAPLF